jgi:hypothetical protein
MESLLLRRGVEDRMGVEGIEIAAEEIASSLHPRTAGVVLREGIG